MKTIAEELLEAACLKGLNAGRAYSTEGQTVCPACPTLICPASIPCPTANLTTLPAKSAKKTTIEIESAKCGNTVKHLRTC